MFPAKAPEPVGAWLEGVFRQKVSLTGEVATGRFLSGGEYREGHRVGPGNVGEVRALRLHHDRTVRVLVAFQQGDAWVAPGDLEPVSAT